VAPGKSDKAVTLFFKDCAAEKKHNSIVINYGSIKIRMDWPWKHGNPMVKNLLKAGYGSRI
jgi:hypothetical protein